MAHHKNIKGSNYTRLLNKGSFVTIIHKICDRYSIFRYAILTISFLVMVGCGSKKKTLEVTKEERIENKDLSVFKISNVNTSIDFLSEMATYKFTPVDPKKPIRINGLEIDNAIVDFSNKKVDSTVQVDEQVTEQVKDKGEVYENNKTKNMDLEREDTSNNIKWSIWGIALVFIVAYFIWKKR